METVPTWLHVTALTDGLEPTAACQLVQMSLTALFTAVALLLTYAFATRVTLEQTARSKFSAKTSETATTTDYV